MPKVYSYLRFSSPEQARGDSKRRQLQLAQDYATKHGLELDTSLTFHDLGVSAYRGSNVETGRLGDFLDAVKKGLVPQGSTLLVESLDRISRQTARRALRVLESIVDEGITLHTISDGQTYTRDRLDNDPTALFMPLVIFLRANDESKMKSERGRAAWAAKRANAANKKLTAKCPAWVRLEGDRFVVIPERAKIVKRIYAEALAGHGQHAITSHLNADKVPTFGRAPHWRRSTVIKILDSPAVIGRYVPAVLSYEGAKKFRTPQTPIDNYFPPVVDRETYESVRLLRDTTAAPLRGKHAGAALVNILGGLAKCPICADVTMTRVNKGKGNGSAKLVCTAAKSGAADHPYFTVNCDEVERAIILRAREIVRECPPASEGGKGLDREIRHVENEIGELEDDLDLLLLSKSKGAGKRQSAAELRLGELQRRIAELRSRRRAADNVMLRSRLSDLRDALTTTPLDIQKANTALRQLVYAVIVDYRHGELDLHWHHSPDTTSIIYDPFIAETLAEREAALKRRPTSP